jgi:hypothetical protein
MTLPDSLRTRDRRQVSKIELRDEITGEVPMIGACRWRRDGRILQTPTMTFSGESAGPLDLILTPPEGGDGPRHASLIAALDDPNQSGTCCD